MTKQNNLMWTILILGLVLVAILGVTSKPKIIVNPSSETDTISVSGNAELTVDPDEIEIYIEIQTLEDTAVETKNINAEISDDVIADLKKAGVRSDDIETSNYNLYPKYEWNRVTEESELVGYELRHILKVTHDDIDKAGDLIDVAVDAGANRIDNVLFTLSDEKEKDARDEAMERAAETASDKAKKLTKTLGVSLGKIKTISESTYYYTPYTYRGDALKVEAAGDVPTNIQPQKLDVTATVHLSFEIS